MTLLKLPVDENTTHSFVTLQEVGGDNPQVRLVLLHPAFDADLYGVVESLYYVAPLSSTTRTPADIIIANGGLC